MARLGKVAEVDQLSPGRGKLLQVEGRDIALFNVKGAYHAMGAVCPHEDGALHEGDVDVDTIVRPWHGYDFNVKTGECSVNPELRVLTNVLTAEGNDVFIEMA